MSAIWSLQQALAAAINADATVTALAGADCVFGEVVPQGRPLPYITLGSANESSEALFMSADLAAGTDIHLWAATRQDVLALYGAVADVLDGVALTLGGYRLRRVRFGLTAVLTDPSGILHGVVRYTSQAVPTP